MNDGLTPFKEVKQNPEIPFVRDVDPTEVRALRGQVKIIDVRRPDEFIGELGHIQGATLLTLDFLPQKMNELNAQDTIVFVCRSGARSARASAFAAQNGFKNVFNMQGGMLKWNDLRFEIETKES